MADIDESITNSIAKEVQPYIAGNCYYLIYELQGIKLNGNFMFSRIDASGYYVFVNEDYAIHIPKNQIIESKEVSCDVFETER